MKIVKNVLFGIVFIATVAFMLLKNMFKAEKKESSKEKEIINLEKKKDEIVIEEKTDTEIKDYWDGRLQ